LIPVGSRNEQKIGRSSFLNWLHKPKEEIFSAQVDCPSFSASSGGVSDALLFLEER
jgi:hypothetical protein